MNAGSRIKKRMQKLRGTLRRKNAKGSFYYRLTVANGVRREFALKTTDELEALQRAEELDSIWAAPTMDVAVAQINAMKGFSRQAQMLPLSEGWAKYEIHPDVQLRIQSANNSHTRQRMKILLHLLQL